jgi:hypothetical protein
MSSRPRVYASPSLPRELLDAHPRDRPGDHELLDLLGALEDVVGLTSGSVQVR